MTTPELIQFVKNEITAGVTKDIITNKMKAQGWSDFDVIDVFNIIEQKTPMFNQKAQEPKVLFVQSKKKSFKVLLFIIILLLIVGGGFVVYASGYFLSPSRLFSQVINSSRDTNGVNIELQFLVDASSLKSSENTLKNIFGTDFKTLNFDMKGSFDLSDKENLKSDTTFSLKSGDIEAVMNSRAINGSLYINLIKISNMDFVSLKPFENKWIVFPQKSNLGQLSTNPLMASSGFGSKLVNDLTDEQKKNIYNITDKAQFIKITKKHLPEVIEGSLSYHLDFDLDREGITSYLKEVINYLKSIDSHNELASLNESDYIDTMKGLENFHGEMWVGILDNLPHKIIVSGDIINKEKLEDGSVKLSMTMIYSNWDKVMDIEVPSGSVSFEELMSSLFGSKAIINNTGIESRPEDPDDLSKKNIMSNIALQADTFYLSNDNSYKGFCRNKTNGAYPFAITLSANSVYKCNDEVEVWASGVQLSTKDYWCADATGFAGVSNSLPKGTSCPIQ
ncbi:TPA: hypothetical protein DCX66_03730 [Candidatus Nomurabacteria bacterium]|uniref:Uncharacterized protein n=1 Tax=Candidatus Nomurabacteria bacterium GW2011_GWE1_35_16 TaxID=1618761 RepID=A0A0G0BBR9_9BACT|nr:MAG: hypothetical protein UR55_C0001G0002 [Candidatus Nomurabacteria bacterium GW2011_GWF1_34_20]KKP63711.1 MAG: hypothetical protein UR57_C0001G0002 [Candidatus Nomurabacteria bacterium GW2011_GWE2_34_25]KKP66923.1 MAG: hypothetical protein UR64_C0001G0002 [Candidatus Nomurabacteria bacterium GW2011_GWE1_35_16]HAE36749.1 hypothetical protein [Candidatus Nomurabacteria bacterium]HAX65548.1 hypothetical protein [Candidatus Nomurabacteria bacterium]